MPAFSVKVEMVAMGLRDALSTATIEQQQIIADLITTKAGQL